MIEFYRLPGCPYCAKVETTLEKLDIDYEAQDVPRSHSDRKTVQEISGQTGVPVLVDPANDVTGMTESSDIVDYLTATYG